MRPAGGILGGALALEGGNENQVQGTPHFHGQAHAVGLPRSNVVVDSALHAVSAGVVGLECQGRTGIVTVGLSPLLRQVQDRVATTGAEEDKAEN